MTPQLQKFIEELYLKKYDALFNYALSSLKSNTLAEEAVQETFRVVCARANVLEESENVDGWLIRILKKVILHTKRQRYTAEMLLAEYIKNLPSDYGVTVDSIDVDLLYNNVVDSEELQLMKELAFDGLSILELAHKRGMSVEACKKRIQRARKILQKRIK